MAKRKRLELPKDTETPVLETKSALSPAPRTRMPIADVAGDTAGRAALEEVAREMTAAESEGRIVKRLKLDQIDVHHLNRDRIALDDEEMEVLKASLADRGQQTPIEVVRTGARYGLISGMRRLLALRDLGQGEVLALIRQPDTAQAAYVAMVEENEIRAPLSFYERANLVVASVGTGIYPNPRAAVAGLFAHVPAPKRSKILKFVTIREKIGASLNFPAAIPEHLGLALATALQTDGKLASRITSALRKTPPADAASERRVLERALKGQGPAKPEKVEIAPGLVLEAKKGRAVLSGKGVDETFVDALKAFAVSHAKT